jgi:hypothetical protein
MTRYSWILKYRRDGELARTNLILGFRPFDFGFRNADFGSKNKKTEDRGFRDLGIEELRDSGIKELKGEKLINVFNP